MSLVDLFTNDSLFADFDRLLDNVVARGTWRAPWRSQFLGDPLDILSLGKPIHLGFSTFVLPHAVLMQKHRVNVREDKEKNLVSATFELPGLNRENVSVAVRDTLLAVLGESKSDSGSNGSWYLREQLFRRFSRSFHIPEGVKVCSFHRCHPSHIIQCFVFLARGDQGVDGEWCPGGHLPVTGL